MTEDQPNTYGQWAADTVAHQAAKADQVVLWDLREADHAEAFLQGLCTVTFAEYSARLKTVVERLTAQGANVALVRATPADVIRVMEENNLPKDAGGGAAAVGLLFTASLQNPLQP